MFLLHFTELVSFSRFWGGESHLVYIGDSRVRQLYLAARAWAAGPGVWGVRW